jgi:hypothetical protein
LAKGTGGGSSAVGIEIAKSNRTIPAQARSMIEAAFWENRLRAQASRVAIPTPIII